MKFTLAIKLGIISAAAGLMVAAGAHAAGASDPVAGQPTPCITPAGAIYSTNCDGVGSGNGGGSALGDTTTVPATTGATGVTSAATPVPTASPALTPGTMPSPETTVTPATTTSGGGSNLPDTGAMTVLSSAIGLGAIGYAGRMYWKRRKLANEPVRPMRAQSDPETLDIANISA